MELVKHTQTRLTHLESWHEAGERRRRAAAAAASRDADELWSLTRAYATLHGDAGAKGSGHTERAYERGVRDLVKAWEGENLARPDRDAAALYVRRLEEDGRSASTIRVRLAAARMLYRALRWAGVTETAPFEGVRPARDPTAPWDKRQPYSEEELNRLLQNAGPADRALLLLGAHAGLRVSEATALEWRDIDMPARVLVVRAGKGGKVGRVVMSRTLAEALDDLRAPEGAARDRPLAFGPTRARQRMEVLSRRAGVPYRGVHALRHYSGTRAAREHGGNLEPVARHLRHSNIETARIYAKWSDETLRHSVGEW